MTTYTPVGISPNYSNPMNYHGVGDGTTNDTVAVLAAMTAAKILKIPVLLPMTEGGGKFLIVSTNAPARQPAIQLDASYSGLKLVGGGGSGIVVDSVCIDGVSGSPGIELQTGFHDFDVEGVTFYGPENDDKDLNFFAAIQMANGTTDVRINNSTFDHITPVNAASAPQGSDTTVSARLLVQGCHMRNCPNGIHPPSDTKILNSWFVCDEVVSTRAQAIYSFGSFSGLQVMGCTFYRINKQAIQFRGVEANWNFKDNCQVIGNSFIECNAYANFIGSDSYPNVTGVVISGNYYLNCNGPIQAQGLGSGAITGNVIHYDWRYPFPIDGFGVAISATTGVGLPGHYAVARGINITGNKVSVVHPFVGKLQFTANPADGNTITVGTVTYTWRNSPSTALDIQRDGTTRGSVDNLVAALRGFGDQVLGANPVLRSSLDAFNDFYGSNPTLAIVASHSTFVMSAVGSYVTVTPTVDMRGIAPTAINASYLIAPHIADNLFDDSVYGLVVESCTKGSIYNNRNTSQMGQERIVVARYNTRMHYQGNKCVAIDDMRAGSPAYNVYIDGFSVIDDEQDLVQEGTNEALLGRSGVTTIGDGKAYNWFWYGRPIDSDIPSTDMFSWRDGDTLILDNGFQIKFKYKAVSPNAGDREFNSADGLLALFNAVAGLDAAYATYTNRLVTPNPKVMMRLSADSTGTSANSWRLYVRRYSTTVSEASHTTTPQPLLNGCILRNAADSEEYQRFQGGSAALDTTFVYTSLANASRGVEVWGADAASVALAPHVYAADIVPGVGFWIRHGTGVGTERFFYRVNV